MELAKCSAKLRAGPDSSRTFAAALLGHVIDSNLDSVRVMRSGCKPQTDLKKPHSSTLFREINLAPAFGVKTSFHLITLVYSGAIGSLLISTIP